IVENNKYILDSLKANGSSLAAFGFVLSSRSTPLHLHRREYLGVPYGIFEKLGFDSMEPTYAVFAEGVKFPAGLRQILEDDLVSLGINYTEDRDGVREFKSVEDGVAYWRHIINCGNLDDFIFERMISQDPKFRELGDRKRPQLKAGDSLEIKNSPYKGKIPKNTQIPYYYTESFSEAETVSEATIRAFLDYGEGAVRALKRVMADRDLRLAFGTSEDQNQMPTQRTEFLKRLGFEVPEKN
ncbi:hypothetical protein HYT24_00230, partial [Candidatus Pacearchaeota archaeon]|nr:hypothetical protein [Candidatus Pacearchaeota archaeon]